MNSTTQCRLTLFYQPECHLCDEAEALLRSLGLAGRVTRVNIENDLELLKRYGFTVPVLQREDSCQELLWPFGAEELAKFAAVPGPPSPSDDAGQ